MGIEKGGHYPGAELTGVGEDRTGCIYGAGWRGEGVAYLGAPVGAQPDLVAHVGHVLPPVVERVHLTRSTGMGG